MSRWVKAVAAALAIASVMLIAAGCGSSQDSTAATVAASGGSGGTAGGDTPGGSATVQNGTGAYTIKDGETLSGGTYSSTKADENAIRAAGTVTATLKDVSVQKTAGAASNYDASSLYGLNAAILALGDADLTINGGTVTASAEGADGVFAYGHSIIRITGTTVDVLGANAGGLVASGGGWLYATDLTVNSTAQPALRRESGAGIVWISGGTYTTSGGAGAPVIYNTGSLPVGNATLTAKGSEALVIEGPGALSLDGCTVTGNMSGTYSKTDTANNIHNVMLYRTSSDTRQGTSSFMMNWGTLVSKNGDMFYVTNTSSEIVLFRVDLTLADGAYLLRVAGNTSEKGWGTAGANGGTCTFSLSNQTASGDILVDSISSLTMTIGDSSTYTGAINSDKTSAKMLSVILDSTSKWIMTGDSYVTVFKGSMKNVTTNGHRLYVNGKAKDWAPQPLTYVALTCPVPPFPSWGKTGISKGNLK